MSFADEIRQISNNHPKSNPKLTELEVYNIMLEDLYHNLQDRIRNNSRSTGELKGILVVSECISGSTTCPINAENLHTSLYSISPAYEDYSEQIYFTDFCKTDVSFFFNICTVSLTDTGQKVTNDLMHLFKTDGLRIWYSTVITYPSSRTFVGDEEVNTDFGVKTKLYAVANVAQIRARLVLHYEI